MLMFGHLTFPRRLCWKGTGLFINFKNEIKRHIVRERFCHGNSLSRFGRVAFGAVLWTRTSHGRSNWHF